MSKGRKYLGIIGLSKQLRDIGFMYLLLRYCSVGPILIGLVEIWQDGHSSSAAMAESSNLNQQIKGNLRACLDNPVVCSAFPCE